MNIGKANLILKDGRVVGRITPRKTGQRGFVWTFVKKDVPEVQVRVLGDQEVTVLTERLGWKFTPSFLTFTNAVVDGNFITVSLSHSCDKTMDRTVTVPFTMGEDEVSWQKHVCQALLGSRKGLAETHISNFSDMVV